ncbi:hypothetical protein B9Z19DRAFT_1082497 [Tuber borchii]|uniref:Uncharacterized protein n=1 Tax=Tuber borchii TaxID=42251 RepID=A0A2T6ZUI4_TUBBO|nr:hypothetical protein B9Z19DRAFT_1082497 [Tuber borchii]
MYFPPRLFKLCRQGRKEEVNLEGKETNFKKQRHTKPIRQRIEKFKNSNAMVTKKTYKQTKTSKHTQA